MKNRAWAILLLGLVITSCTEKQTKFLELNEITQEQDSLVIFYLRDLVEWPGDRIDASVTPKIEKIHIKFTLDPSTDDDSKKIFIADLKTALQKIETIKSVSNIKSVSFDIGEQIFVTQSEVDSLGGDYYKIAELNLQRAWTELSPQLKKLFPEATFYAYNWGW